jgi:hypothetical protein
MLVFALTIPAPLTTFLASHRTYRLLAANDTGLPADVPITPIAVADLTGDGEPETIVVLDHEGGRCFRFKRR